VTVKQATNRMIVSALALARQDVGMGRIFADVHGDFWYRSEPGQTWSKIDKMASLPDSEDRERWEWVELALEVLELSGELTSGELVAKSEDWKLAPPFDHYPVRLIG
jgi:hypothetical protein